MKEKIAIVGAGISGISAAYFLQKKYDVTLFERNSYFGGHSNTADINVRGKSIAVDTGFIVFNERTYKNLVPFFDLLGVESYASDMSFGAFIEEDNIEYSGASLKGLFAQPKNFIRLEFWKMLFSIVKFNRVAQHKTTEELADITLEDLLHNIGVSDSFKKWYLYPMVGAIWSTPVGDLADFPALTFTQFFKNHGLLTIFDQPQWYTVKGGSREYVKKALESIHKYQACPVTKITRGDNFVDVETKKGCERFDQVVFACPANCILPLLDQPTSDEKKILSAFGYSKNNVYLHCDAAFMPTRQSAWSSWNYFATPHGALGVTYWMNKLQNLDTDQNIFVTLNPQQSPKKDHVFKEVTYFHPILNQKAIKAQEEISNIQGKNRTWYCGSYQRYGFHEDGIWSTLRVVNALEVKAPWQT